MHRAMHFLPLVARLRTLMLENAMQDPVPVLLKEFLPGARSVACNELQTLVHLAEGLPGSKWHAARAPMTADIPIVPLLGKEHPSIHPL